MSLDILKNDTPPESGATTNGVGRGLETITPVKTSGRRGPQPGHGGRPPKNGVVAPPTYAPPTEKFKPEDVLPVIELPFKLAGVALRSDAVDLETDEKERLSRTGATAANHWLEVSPKAFTGVIFLTTLTQVLLAKVILFKAEQRDKLEAAEKLKSNAQPTTAS